MIWMISKAKDNVREVEALIDAKSKFLESMQDLGTIKTLNCDDYTKLGIPDGLGKRLSRDVKSFMKE
jgi:hypothetical protein